MKCDLEDLDGPIIKIGVQEQHLLDQLVHGTDQPQRILGLEFLHERLRRFQLIGALSNRA